MRLHFVTCSKFILGLELFKSFHHTGIAQFGKKTLTFTKLVIWQKNKQTNWKVLDIQLVRSLCCLYEKKL